MRAQLCSFEMAYQLHLQQLCLLHQRLYTQSLYFAQIPM
ncbi:hypothetical protein [Salinibacter phage 8_2]